MIVEVAVGLEIKKSFDYDAKNFPNLKKGMRVLVDFNNKKRVGFVINIKKKKTSKFTLKPIIEVLDSYPAFPSNLLNFSKEISKKYLYSRGSILEMMLPLHLRRNRKLVIDIEENSSYTLFNPSQKSLKLRSRDECNFSLLGREPHPLGLRGSTKSNTTYIREDLKGEKRFFYYIKMILQSLKEGRRVIICLPEKEDSFKIKEILEEHIKDVKISLLFGSQKSSSQFKEWLKIRSLKADICIGSRFAIFSPFINLGLIIVEKENFYGYFQPQKPFYHLRDLALMRAKKEKANLVLHSDFPSLEVYKLLKEKKAEFIDLFKENTPKIKIFDLRNYKFKRYPLFSELAQELVRKYLETSKKVIVFWNRKGFSNILRCSFCKEILKCPKCESFLSFSSDKKAYICKKCGYKREAKSKCPKCRQGYIRNIGVGIERIEANFKRIFPGRRIVKLSKDSLLKAFDWDILISTQKIFFLEDIPSADLLIVSGLDSLFSWQDYSSSLELFLLIERLKCIAKEEFIIFTFNPQYYPFKALTEGWEWFYKEELSQRRSLKFPPYSHIAKVTLRQKKEKFLLKNINSFKKSLEKKIHNKQAKIIIYGPLKDKPFRRGGKYHYFLLIKAKKLRVLKDVLDKAIGEFKKSSATLSLIIT